MAGCCVRRRAQRAASNWNRPQPVKPSQNESSFSGGRGSAGTRLHPEIEEALPQLLPVESARAVPVELVEGRLDLRAAVRVAVLPLRLAVGKTVILLHLPLPLVGVSTVMERERQGNDSLANG